MKRGECLIAFFIICLFVAAPLFAERRVFHGFFTPEFSHQRRPPYAPVSASAVLEMGRKIRGELRLRDIGTYEVEGKLIGDRVELDLVRQKQAAGQADGTLSALSLKLRLQLFGDKVEVAEQGTLLLDAAAQWLGSEVVKSRRDYKDGSGRSWYEVDFNDRSWSPIDLPDDNSFGEQTSRSRLYRSRFHLEDPNETLQLIFSSDDGIWIYINGRFLGHWGADEDDGGCVNDPLNRCGENGIVPPVTIPSALLHPGENLIAVKVNNGHCCFTYFNLLLTRVQTRLTIAPP